MQLPAKIVLTALAMGIVFDALLYHAFYPGINILLLELIFLSVVYVFAHFNKIHINNDAHVATVFSLLFAGTFAVWTSDLGMTLAFLGFIFANVIFIFAVAGHNLKYQHPFQFALDSVVHAMKLVALRFDVLANVSFATSKKHNAAFWRGVIIAVPVLLVFAALFLQSDLVLQYQTETIFDWLFDNFDGWEIIPNLLIIGFFSVSFLLILAALFWKRFEFANPASYTKDIATEGLVVLVASAVLFLGFLVFQGVYLFGGQSAFDAIPNITYSEYAVNGFGELAVVAILVVLLIISLRFFHGVKHDSKKLHVAQIVLLIETLALLISAWMRLSLYVSEYGYTPARIFGFWFFITVGLIILFLAVHIWRRLDQSKFLRQTAVLLASLTLIFIAISPDSLSVRLNIARSQDSGELMDLFPLFNQLSAEAYPLMDYVINSGEIYFGLLDTSVTDYCPYIYRRADASGFEIGLNRSDMSEDLMKDVILRETIAAFENEWLLDDDGTTKIRRSDWRSWNWARSRLPEMSDKVYEFFGPADTYMELAQMCNSTLGDVE